MKTFTFEICDAHTAGVGSLNRATLRDLEDDALVAIWETQPKDVSRQVIAEVRRRYDAGDTLIDDETLEAMGIIDL